MIKAQYKSQKLLPEYILWMGSIISLQKDTVKLGTVPKETLKLVDLFAILFLFFSFI
jgi:hypothetical protein